MDWRVANSARATHSVPAATARATLRMFPWSPSPELGDWVDSSEVGRAVRCATNSLLRPPFARAAETHRRVLRSEKHKFHMLSAEFVQRSIVLLGASLDILSVRVFLELIAWLIVLSPPSVLTSFHRLMRLLHLSETRR